MNLTSRLNPPEVQPYIYISKRYNPGSATSAATSKPRGLSVQKRMVHNTTLIKSAWFALHQLNVHCDKTVYTTELYNLYKTVQLKQLYNTNTFPVKSYYNLT